MNAFSSVTAILSRECFDVIPKPKKVFFDNFVETHNILCCYSEGNLDSDPYCCIQGSWNNLYDAYCSLNRLLPSDKNQRNNLNDSLIQGKPINDFNLYPDLPNRMLQPDDNIFDDDKTNKANLHIVENCNDVIDFLIDTWKHILVPLKESLINDVELSQGYSTFSLSLNDSGREEKRNYVDKLELVPKNVDKFELAPRSKPFVNSKFSEVEVRRSSRKLKKPKHFNEHNERGSSANTRTCKSKVSRKIKSASHAKIPKDVAEATITGELIAQNEEVNVQPMKNISKQKGFLNRNRNRTSIKNQRVLNCHYCYSEFNNLDKLIQHARHEYPENDFCIECRKQFPNSELHHAHQNDVHGKFLCLKCSLVFSEQSKLTTHETKHDVTDYKCNECSEYFSSINLLLNHAVESHDHQSAPSDSKKYQCPRCDKSYDKRDNLVKHLNAHKGMKLYCCEICSASFSYHASLKSHLITHGVIQEVFTCKNCQKTFNYKSSYRQHLITHDQKQFSCKFCEKKFHQNSAVIRHERTHTGLKPFTCEFCKMSFSDTSILRRHRISRHNKEDKANVSYNDVQTETPCSQNEKRFKCDHCGQCFLTKCAFDLHFCETHINETDIDTVSSVVKTKSNVEGFNCKSCDKSYSLKSSLTRHEKNAHQDDVSNCEKGGTINVQAEETNTEIENDVYFSGNDVYFTDQQKVVMRYSRDDDGHLTLVADRPLDLINQHDMSAIYSAIEESISSSTNVFETVN